jgi:hypothetical protein
MRWAGDAIKHVRDGWVVVVVEAAIGKCLKALPLPFNVLRLMSS